jgi:5-formaminoimidazole-4-carboxamide-1-(beta)-D-ribofuranosyl 5'-monophosphate synthetase
MIERDDMQEVVKRFKEPKLLNLGSHSALDAAAGARDYGIRSIIYTTPQRAIIYLQNPTVGEPDDVIEDLPLLVRNEVIVTRDISDLKKNGWKRGILILDNYSDILKHVDELIELECIQIPNRAFTVYVGDDEKCSSIEKQFSVPILGSRRLLKVENRGLIEKDYYWFAKKAGIPIPKEIKYKVTKNGVKFDEKIDQPILLKTESKHRKYERGFIFAANSEDMERKIEIELESGHIDEECLKDGRIEEYIPGPHGNFNFFYSPLNAKESWGDTEKYFSEFYDMSIEDARKCLANEFLSIDERRETTHDGVLRLPADVQTKVDWNKTPYPLTFEVTAHCDISLRESLLKDIHKTANAFLLTTQKIEPPGIIGAWCLQTMITWTKVSGIGGVNFGLYDVPEGSDVFMHVPVTQDVALRHGGGTNTHMGIGGKYANAKYIRRMSMGDRIALELKRAKEKKMLEEIVT